MEVGSLRERIIIALLIHKFGGDNVNKELPIHEPEIDVLVEGNPISIKTITGKRVTGIKLIWTVDRDQVLQFREKYEPCCDMLLTQINWENEGGVYLFTKELQSHIFIEMGRENYIKLPKPGTNPRGVEMATQAVRALTKHRDCKKIPVKWVKTRIDFNPYQRWLTMWEEE